MADDEQDIDLEKNPDHLITLELSNPSEDDLAQLEAAALKSKRTSVKIRDFLTKSHEIPPSPMRIRKNADSVVNLADIEVNQFYSANSEEPEVQITDLQKQIKKAKEQEESERKEALRSKVREDVNDSKIVKIFDSLFCFKLPMMNLPLGPILFIFFMCTLLGVLFFYMWRNLTWGGPKMYNWFWWGGNRTKLIGIDWLDFVLITYILIHLSWKVVLLIIKKVFFFSKFFYYINGLAGMATLLIWSIVQKAAWKAILQIDSDASIDEKAVYYVGISILILCCNSVDHFLTLFIYVSILRSVKLVAVKALIAYSQRNTFWQTLSVLLFNERVLRVLSKNPKKKNIDQHLNTALQPLTNTVFAEEPEISAVEFRKAWRKVFKREANNKKFVRDVVNLSDVVDTVKNIFKNVDPQKKGYFTAEDLRPFFRSQESIDVVFELFDKDRDGKVGFDEASIVVRDVYQSRKALYATLHDREDIASILTNSLGVVFWFLMFLLGLTTFGVETSSLLIPLGSAFVTLGVVFGATFRDFWENFIFIWQVRPFDVGDKVVIDTFPTLVINRIHLMYTEAYASDGRQFLIPNNFLKTKVITQYKRSRNYAVYVQTHFLAQTPKEKIDKLQKRIRKFLREDPAPWDHDEAMMWISDMTNTNRMTLDLWVELKGVTWQTSKLFLLPKSRLWQAIQQICMDLDINYEMPIQRKEKPSFKAE